MKRTTVSVISLIAALAMIFALAGCGKTSEPEKAADFTVNDIYTKITETVAMPEEKLELTADDLIDYYGIEADKVAECAAVQDACGYKDEIVIIKAKDEASVKEIEAIFNDHIEYQKEEMKNYDAEQFAVLGSSKVSVNGLYAAMFISANQNEMNEIFNSFFK